jgi:hypothetical protein
VISLRVNSVSHSMMKNRMSHTIEMLLLSLLLLLNALPLQSKFDSGSDSLLPTVTVCMCMCMYAVG